MKKLTCYILMILISLVGAVILTGIVTGIITI